MSRLLFLSTIFAFCHISVVAQSITGDIRDSETGKPVADVRIGVNGSAYMTLSDQEGKFILDHVEPGSTIRFSAVGYASYEQAADSAYLRILMQRTAIILNNDITITAKRYEKLQFDVNESVTVLNSKELQEMSPRSAPEALMGSAGVWIQKTNHGGGSPVIRGLIGNQVLLMVDGIRMNNATYRYGPNQYMATVDPGLIERIEAIRGNGSVLYGSDAIGGVVQVISKTPFFQINGQRFHAIAYGKWMSAGMEKSLRGEGQWSNKNVALQAGISARDFGDVLAGKNLGSQKPTGYHELSGDAKLLVSTGNDGVLTAAWQHHRQSDVPRYDQVTQGGYSRYSFDPQQRQLAYLRWETNTLNPLVESFRVTTALNRSDERIVSQRNGSTDIKTQNDIVRTWSCTAEIHSSMRDHWKAQSGIEFYHDLVNSTARNLNTATREETSLRGSYADGATSDNVAFFSSHVFELNRLTFSAGGRFNLITVSVKDATFGDQQIKPYAWVGNAGLSYKIHGNHRLIMSANTGFRAPNIDDVSKFGAVESTVFEIPSTRLSPEKSQTIEIGLKSNTKNFSGSVTAYHTSLSDLIERMPALVSG